MTVITIIGTNIKINYLSVLFFLVVGVGSLLFHGTLTYTMQVLGGPMNNGRFSVKNIP